MKDITEKYKAASIIIEELDLLVVSAAKILMTRFGIIPYGGDNFYSGFEHCLVYEDNMTIRIMCSPQYGMEYCHEKFTIPVAVLENDLLEEWVSEEQAKRLARKLSEELDVKIKKIKDEEMKLRIFRGNPA